MEVILTMDVPDVGSRGERVEVAPGFARNYLIPRRLAMPVTPGNVRILAEENRLVHVRDRKSRRQAERVRAFLAEHELFTTLKVGREGKAFGSITSMDIAVLLRKEGLEVDRRRIRLDVPIRRLGVFEIALALHPEVETKVRLFVDREGGSREGALAEQALHEEERRLAEEAAKAEARARLRREKEAEEAARIAIERAAARKARQEEAERARAERAEAAARGGSSQTDADSGSPEPTGEGSGDSS